MPSERSRWEITRKMDRRHRIPGLVGNDMITNTAFGIAPEGKARPFFEHADDARAFRKVGRPLGSIAGQLKRRCTWINQDLALMWNSSSNSLTPGQDHLKELRIQFSTHIVEGDEGFSGYERGTD